MNASDSTLAAHPKPNLGGRGTLFSIMAAGIWIFPQVVTAQLTVNLGSATGFGVLAGSTITDVGGISLVTGNVGLYPAAGSAIGLTAGQVLHGSIFKSETSGPLLNTAQIDLTSAYNDAAGRIPTVVMVRSIIPWAA